MLDTRNWLEEATKLRDEVGNCNLTYNGKTRSILGWARELNVASITMYSRLAGVRSGKRKYPSLFRTKEEAAKIKDQRRSS